MAAFFLFVILSFATLTGGIAVAKTIDQTMRDKLRKTYRLNFPADLDPERVTAWLRSISGTLRTSKWSLFTGAPSIALEAWATNAGIEWRIKLPWNYEPYIKPNLESLVPGIRMTPESEHPVRVWVHAVEAGVHHTERQLRLYNPSDLSTSILANFGTLHDGETLMMQWVVAPAPMEHKPVFEKATSTEFNLFVPTPPTRDEVDDRRDKLDEPNMLAVLRVGAVANTPVRAQFMVRGVMAALDSVRGPATKFYKRVVGKEELQRRMDRAASPLNWPIKLSAPELTAVIAWPLGNPMVAGLPAAVSRYLPAAESVPTTGRIIGMSTFPGRERKIAMPYPDALKHFWSLGGTGSGKSVLLANMIKQDMEQGYGVVLIENKGDLFHSALDYVPPSRINEVIVLDVNDTDFPVGFNILRQGDPAVAVDKLNMVFNALYKDSPSLWMQEVMYHGLHTLAADKSAAFTDLGALVSPAADEGAWRDKLIRQVRDPQIKNFWQRLDNQPPSRRDQIAQPVLSRVWPMSRSKLLSIVGQSTSSFEMADVITKNKILLVNLSGIEAGAAQIMGTLLTNAVWDAVKANKSDKGTFLYMDEFHHYMNLPVNVEEMLVEARSMGLGMVLAHQHLDQLPADLRHAIMSNARTKVVFQSSADDAGALAANFGRSVSREDFLHLAKYEAIARVETSTGLSSPLTLRTLPPAKPYGKGKQVRYVSRQQYGRPVAEVHQDILTRRTDERNERVRKPAPGAQGWGSLG